MTWFALKYNLTCKRLEFLCMDGLTKPLFLGQPMSSERLTSNQAAGQSVIGFAWETRPKSIFKVTINVRSALTYLIGNGQESDDVPESRTR